jgi:hypothetical protein
MEMKASRASSLGAPGRLHISPGISRRSLLAFIVVAPFSLSATAKNGLTRELVVRNGWILRPDDLDLLG